MPPRSRIDLLPDPLREQLDNLIRFNRYSNYVVIARWLTSQGHPIGKSVVAAYGQQLMKAAGIRPTTRRPLRNKADRDWRRLPPKLQRGLAARLLAGGWKRNVENAAWLQEQGHPIGVAAVEAFARDLTDALAVRHAMALLDPEDSAAT
ncbi:DUF3486 family protein [Pseudoxanthomonas winnipegensis]|uniref:phage protein Gp27 family protein n=1 Tax=Pseudoxanthomonas winnipegensis TaxID=2480810 RepID=UPI00102DC9E1|nr:phage protein Gp27 family protein [Pseudoxanthomonas winnipegensis]TAA40693.1 DUF3486 family protein [Pseudoxanthomonas winnipegensis]